MIRLAALTAGLLLDSIIGDSIIIMHPIKAIGLLISFFEGLLYKDKASPLVKRIRGILLVAFICILVPIDIFLILKLSYRLNFVFGLIIESFLCCYALAAHSLKKESMKVYDALKSGSLNEGRKAVSMIVGRDTNDLTKEGVISAAVETVAENTSDGVIAPMMYLFIGGPILGYLYKAINTMDSMIGYKNDRYADFGFAAAKLDDIANFVPSRLCALFMIVSAFFLRLDYKNAIRIFRRDRFNHKSPNSAQTESVMAGALTIRLAGPASYFGVLIDKPYIGDNIREINLNDIRLANRLMYVTTLLFFMFCAGVLCMAAIFIEMI